MNYTVNVHYDAVYTTNVKANSEEEAIEIANSMAENANNNEFELVSNTDTCITNVE